MSIQTKRRSPGSVLQVISSALGAQSAHETPRTNSVISHDVGQPGIRAYRVKRKAHNKSARRARRMTSLRG